MFPCIVCDLHIFGDSGVATVAKQNAFHVFHEATLSPTHGADILPMTLMVRKF